MTHSDYVKRLSGAIGDNLVMELCLKVPTIKAHYKDLIIKYWCLNEFTVRLDKGTTLPDGRFEHCNRRFDAMLLVVPSLSALAQQWTFKVGIEVKASKSNLMKDNKIFDYLGWTDYFFVAAPNYLVKFAVERFKDSPRIGILSLDSGDIVKMPAWQDISTGRKLSIMEQAFYGYKVDALCGKEFRMLYK